MNAETVVAIAQEVEPGCRTKIREQFEGWGVEIGFRNGYGADVACSLGTYGGHEGLAETAVTDGFGGPLIYNTPVTNDVLGWQDHQDVRKTLQQIADLDRGQVAADNAIRAELAARGTAVSRADAQAMLERIQAALAESADDDTVYLGDFTQYLED